MSESYTRRQRCHRCGAGPEEERLQKCPTCHQCTCHDHAWRRGGKSFCSKRCAEEFFYGEGPEDEPVD